jgi:hypothetical protein
MKKSTNVVVGKILLAGSMFALAGCTDEPDQEFMDVQADYTEVCVEVVNGNDLIRREDAQCADDTDGGSHAIHTNGLYWYYLGRAVQAPPVGGYVLANGGRFTRPSAGTIAHAPAKGGFGMTRATVAG